MAFSGMQQKTWPRSGVAHLGWARLYCPTMLKNTIDLREIRQRRGLSLKRAAAALGTNKSDLSRLECGIKQGIEIDYGFRLSQLYDVPLEEIRKVSRRLKLKKKPGA